MPKKNCLQRPDAFQNFMHFSGFFEAMDCWYIYMANGKNQCSHINFNIKLNINIKINIDINIIQTLLASLYTLTPFPKISLKHQEDFGPPSMPSEAHLVTSEWSSALALSGTVPASRLSKVLAGQVWAAVNYRVGKKQWIVTELRRNTRLYCARISQVALGEINSFFRHTSCLQQLPRSVLFYWKHTEMLWNME